MPSFPIRLVYASRLPGSARRRNPGGPATSPLTVLPTACLALALGLGLGLAATASAQVATTFDSDLEGWMVTGDNASAWEPAAGNPGGCLAVNDLAIGQLNWVVAPPAYLGDWSAATGADTLSVDYHLTDSDPDDLFAPAFTLSGPGGSARTADYRPPQQEWETVTVPLDPASWTVTSGTWSALLANVTSLRVGGEFVSGPEDLLIDNVALDITPTPVFEPCRIGRFDDGTTGDWSFADTSSSNPGSGGNSGGFVRLGDLSGTSFAFAPASFLGDWSSLEGSGKITLDLRVISASGTALGAARLVRLTGPGGEAHVALAPEDLPTSPLEWRTIEIPLDEDSWTVVSGSWSGLLTEVAEARLELEFFDGNEVVGFDNFGRVAAGCPTVDETVVLHDPSVAVVDRISFLEISGCAYNPADGLLYGLLRESSAGDGLYAVTGPVARTRLQAYDRPAHLIFDVDGDAFVSENFSGDVFRLAAGGGSSTWVSGFHSGDDDPWGFTFAPPGFDDLRVGAGDLLVTDHGNGGPGELWAFLPDVPEGETFVASYTTRTVFDVAGGAEGVVYGADAGDGNHLLEIFPDGFVDTLELSEDIGEPLAVVFDAARRSLFVASETPSTFAVYRVDPTSGGVTLLADGFAELLPAALEHSGDRLWVSDRGRGRVYALRLQLFADGFESGSVSAWSGSAGR